MTKILRKGVWAERGASKGKCIAFYKDSYLYVWGVHWPERKTGPIKKRYSSFEASFESILPRLSFALPLEFLE